MPLHRLAWLLLAGWPSATPLLAESLILPATQDNSIVMVDGEWEDNAGQNGRIRIKGNQHLVAMSFDLTALTGRRVTRAELVCHASAETISGVTISTIAAPWDEHKSNGLSAGQPELNGWGYPGARFPAVCGGNSFTLVHQVNSSATDDVYRWELAPDLVHAMAIGAAFGLAIHEHDADYSRNPSIFSREQSGKQPRLVLEVEDRPDPAPQPAAGLLLIETDARSARLSLQGPADGFAYEVTVNGQPVPRHNIPLVAAGVQQTIALRDLPEAVLTANAHEVAVTTLNRTGQRSAAAIVKGRLFESTPPQTPQLTKRSPQTSRVPGLAVIPITDKYDRKGKPVGELPPDYRTNNPLFDGRTIRLTAAAGEVIGLQLLVRGQQEVHLDLQWTGLRWRTELFQAVFVPSDGREIPDPLLPLPDRLPLSPDSDQAVFVDVYVPFDASPGLRRGLLKVSDGRQLPIELTVLNVQLPKKASFLCEMNSYGLPDHVDDYYALQQVAYDHRVHANILHYSHNTAAPGARKSNLDMRLPNGRRMDNKRYDSIEPGAEHGYWDDFATAFGPFLDGSCFRDGHRGPIPAPGFYLTFHESWPLNCRAYFNGHLDAYQAFSDQPVYANTYVNVLSDFARLAQSRGWTETGFQVYFNNKGSLKETSKAPWILDEPSAYWDYRALQYYGELTDRGRSAANGVSIDYRVDISRPEYCRGQLEARSDLWVVSSWAFQHYRRQVTDRIERDGLKVWVYGTSNHVHESNRQLLAWAVDAWYHGATGLVPWQTVDKTGEALKQADQLGLFIFEAAADGGRPAIRHSSRLKAYREAQQLIEYLHLVQAKQQWSRSQMQAFLAHYLTLSGSVLKLDDADAGTAEYDAASLAAMDTLRQAAIELLKSP
jgi:hypothetical protein